MAGRLTLWGASELLRSFFSQTAEPPPSFYLALVTTYAPTPYTTGSELDEPLADSYARLEIPNDAVSWSNYGDQLHIIFNQNILSFITAVEDWGRIGYWALCNADEGGYVYLSGAMEEEDIVYAGDQVVINAGEISVELGPFFTAEEF